MSGEREQGTPERRGRLRPLLYPFLRPVGIPLLRGLFGALGGLAVEGREHLPASGGILIAANHASFADPPVLATACPRPLWFMANRELFEIPVLGRLIVQTLAFPVAKGGAVDRTALRRSEELLRAGEALCIFPEGATTRDGRLTRFYAGAGLIALRAGVPVIPTGVSGTQRLMPSPGKRPRYTRGGVRVRFGQPLSLAEVPQELERRRQAEWLTERLREAIAALLPPDQQPGGADGETERRSDGESG